MCSRPLRSTAVALVLGLAWPGWAAADLRLLMFEEDWCEWCDLWDEEVGGVYHLTDEGRRAPLRRIDIHAPLPDGIELDRRAHYTPTFVLVEDGREIGRIEGYAGEHFFYPMLQRLLDRVPQNEGERENEKIEG